MNNLERRMLDILAEGREEQGFLSVKAEFEAEGTRTDELLRLLELARRAGVKVGIKIGGCEAIRDMIECRQFGVDYVIAPMIETPYALSKYIDAKNKVFAADERETIKFLYNMETISAFEQLDGLVTASKATCGADGIVFGRVDFCGSLGKTREVIDTDEITAYVLEVARRCRMAGLEMVTGGAVNHNSFDVLRRVKEVHLDRFETRKIIFTSELLDRGDISDALNLAGEFELLWLQNKRNYYGQIAAEDAKRIDMLEKRFRAVSACAA